MLNYKKPRFWIVVVSIIAVIIVGIALLANPLSEEAIFNNIINRDGYAIYEIQKPISFTVYIEPTWIPKNEDEVINLNKEIGEVGKVEILLENVMHRGNDIYFNFDARQFINYDSGEFLYHSTFNEDGTIATYHPSNAFNIYDKKNNKIDVVVGQRGYGPNSKFSFGIDIEYFDVIKDGFTLEYNGGILYGYSNLESTEKELDLIKSEVTGQASDGYGEGFEQNEIQTDDRSIYVSFWNHENWSIKTAEELGIVEQTQTMGGITI